MVGVHTHVIVLQIECILTELDMLEFILVKVWPSPQTSIHDMRETFPPSHLGSNHNIIMLWYYYIFLIRKMNKFYTALWGCQVYWRLACSFVYITCSWVMNTQQRKDLLIFYLLTFLYSVEIFVHNCDLLLSIKCFYYCTDWKIVWSACTDNRFSSLSYSISTLSRVLTPFQRTILWEKNEFDDFGSQERHN